MTQDPVPQGLTARFASDPRGAGDEVFQRYARRLIGLARKRLDGQVLQKVDPEDVLQSVMESFYTRAVDGRLDLDDPKSLWALLAKMTKRKCDRKIRLFHAQSRNVARETRPKIGSGEDSEGGGFDVAGDEPTPLEVATLNETLAVLYGQMKPQERPILERKLQGYTVPEIAEELGFNERKVYRVLEHVKDRLEAMQASEGEGS